MRELGPYGAHGTTVTVTAPDDVAAVVAPLLAPLEVDAGAPVDTALAVEVEDDVLVRLLVDGAVRTHCTRPTLVQHLLMQVNHAVIQTSGPRELLFHAGAVAHDGRAVLLPADMEAGKSTLVGALLDDGWAYLSDEAPAVTDDLDVVAYPKPLSLDRGSWPLLPHREPPDAATWHGDQWQVVPSTILPSAPLAAIVFPKYRAGASGELRPLTPGEVVEHLVPCTFVIGREFIATATVRRLARIAESVPGFAMEHDDLDVAVAAVRTCLD